MTDSVTYKAWVDSLLREWLQANPHNIGPSGIYGWIKHEFKPPGAAIIPLHRMKALPAPFTISEQDRNGRTG